MNVKVVEQHQRIIEVFRSHCRNTDHSEDLRQPIVSRHDPSIRFTNSTISVLKPYLASDYVRKRVFLIQPAIRLRNLDHYLKSGQMSSFGCYFVAFGSLLPMTDCPLAMELVRDFLLDIGLEATRLTLRVSSRDGDLYELAAASGLDIEVDGYEQARYRHRFGIDGLSGRNLNYAVSVRDKWQDVGNLIIIERHGTPIGVEIAFGINNLIACRDSLSHPVYATPGVEILSWGHHQDIAIDAAGSVIALALDGLRPVARGRGGRMRQFLRILVNTANADDWCSPLQGVLERELEIRKFVSPMVNDHSDLDSKRAMELIRYGLARA